MMSKTAPAWAATSSGMAGAAVGAGVGRARDPARSRRRRSPDCRTPSPPTARPTRCGAGSAAVMSALGWPRRATRGRPGPRRSRGAGRRASPSAARSSRPRGTPPGAWSLPPTGPRPSRVGTPMPGRRVGVRRAAGRGVVHAEPEALGDGLGVLDEPGRPLDFSIGRHENSVDSSIVVPGTSVVRRELADRRHRPRRGRRRSTDRDSTSSSQRSGTTLGRVPPRIVPTLNVTPGQRPLRACSSRTIAGRLEDRVRPFSGSTPGVRGAAVDRRAGGRRCPCGTTRCRRWRGRTRGRARRRRPRPPPGCAGVDVGEPTSSSGLAMNVSRSNGTRSPIAPQRVQPGEQPGLHVGHARTGGDAVPSMRNGRSAAVPGSNTVSMWPISSDPRPAGPPSNVPTTVSPSRPSGSGRYSTGRPSSRRNAPVQRPTSSTPAGRVAAAVDVHQVLEVGEEGRQVGLDGCAQRVRGRRRSDGSVTGIAGSLAPLAILPGPCA